MATLDPHEDFQETLKAVTSGLQEAFPIKGRTSSLHLVSVHAGQMPDPEDIGSQYATRVAGKSWMTPIQGVIELRDNETGKVLMTQKTRLMSIPSMTKRFSFIYNGQEHQSANQWQLKPGVFARRQDNGELEARFNVVNRAAFKMKLDPQSQLFHVEYKKANLPAYPLLRAMGVSDQQMEESWGKQVFEANKKVKRQAGVLAQFYRTSTNGKAPPESEEDLAAHLRQVMKESKVRPEVVKQTLAHEVDHVDHTLMLNAGTKLLAVQNGAPEDDRDSLIYKTLRSTGDFLKDQIQASSRNLAMKVQRQLNKGDLKDIRHAFKPGLYDDAVRRLFQSSLVNPAKQINPVDMIGTAMQTTIMGPGGIKSDIQVTDAAKEINPSQFGMIDPLTTPEGGATGISLRLPIGVKRIGDQPHIPVYSIKQKKTIYVNPAQMMAAKKVFADEVEYRNGVPHPLREKVKALGKGNEPEVISFHEADYVMKDPSQVYGTTVNLVPFLQNNSGGRVSMASRHIEQSISLRDRDKPLVRVNAPGGTHTFEEMIGHQSAHTAPVDGRVTRVTADAIHVADASGKEHKVHLYNNYPVNDAKSVLHSTPLVKVGDAVKKGGVVADNNYTRDGVLALGKNLRTAFMSYHGLNFEDGIVITESAAKKLTSNHLHKEMLPIPEVNNQLIFDAKKFQAAHPLAFSKDQLGHIGADGVAKVGAKIRPGDPLVLAMQPYQLKDRTGIGAIRKSLTNQLVDKSLRWESDVPGEVVSVHRNDQGIHVHVRTEEPVRVGDKLSHRHGGKGIITSILPDKDAPRSKDGKPVDILFQPGGLGGRMNIGQVLEAQAGKIAEKTGKPYFVKNFDPKVQDWTRHMMGELKKHGLSDTEELFDPKTGISYGQVMTGPIHFLKLVHQMDKKESMRSGMSLPRVQSKEKYDPTTLQPASGGGTGGQSWGQLGIYALLAHGAKGILRESMTYKSEGEDPETNEAKRWRSQHNEVWNAIQSGQPLPPPKPTFSFHRFTELIKGAGINVDKKGDEFVLSPLTNSHILKMSKGEISDPTAVVHSKRDENGVFKTIKGGLFDDKITGGHGGTGWSHVKLPEPMPNPIFEEPIKKILGITETTYQALVEGKQGVNPLTGKIGPYERGFLVGGSAFKKLLGKIDVSKELAATKKALDSAKPSQVNPLYKKARYLQGLEKTGMRPDEAYVLDYLPIVPPKLRPLSNLDDGALHYDGINGMYNQLGQLTNAMNHPSQKMLPDQYKAEGRRALYDGVSALFGTAALPEGAKDKGILHMIAGSQPKRGIAQKGLLSRRQDASARATIIPEPKLGLDEIGLPKEMAMTILRPQLVRQLVVQGSAKDELAAQNLLAEAHKGKEDPSIQSALNNLANNELVISKRDPALWKYSVQAFRPRIVEGKAIRIHPLVTGGFNADFDGDSAKGLVHVEVSTETGNKEEMPHLGSLPVHGLINLRDFPRQQLLRDDGRVAVYSVPEGVVVPSHLNGVGIVRMPVTEFSIHRDCPLWRVTSRAGRLLEVSEDHSLATLDMNTLDVVETKASGSEGKVFPVMRALAHSHGKDAWDTSCFEGVSERGYPLPQFPLTKASGWFLGAMVGDGWVSDTSKYTNGTAMQISLAYGARGVEVAARWGSFLDNLVPEIAKRSYRNEHEFEGKPALSFRDTVTHSALGRLLQEQLGHGARNKHLPLDFLEWNEQARRGLLAGLLDTDGSVTWVHAATKNKPQFQAAYHTTSAQLAIEVVLLCQSLGIVASYTEYAKRDGLAYNIFLSTSTMQEATWLDLAHPEKKEALERLWGSEPVISGRGDWVPMPPAVRSILLTELRKKGAARKEKTEEGKRAFSLYVVLKKEEPIITRETFALLTEMLGDAVCSEGLMSSWYALCTNPTLSWDVVETAEDTGELHEMYDLTVPDSYTFTMANGAVVWDTMSVQAVLSDEAKRDAARMLPSKNIFSESTGGVAYLPSMESLLGLHRLSLVGQSKGASFSHDKDAIAALHQKKVSLDEQIKVGGVTTTPGRVLLASAVPDEMRNKILTDFSLELNKKGVNAVFTEIGKNHAPRFAALADKLKDLGYDTSTGIINTPLAPQGKVGVGTHSFKLSDFIADTASRDPHLHAADKEVEELKKKGLRPEELKRQMAEAYLRADVAIQKQHAASGKMQDNALGKMTRAGMKPSKDQYKQMVLAPMVMTNSKGELIPVPVRRSYGEGVDQMGYTVQQEGARSGTIKKVQEVQEPGYMTKLLQNTSMHTLIDTHDCGTQKGLLVGVGDYDIMDRHLATPLKLKGLDLPGGTLLSKDIVDRIRKVDPSAKLVVRSPLHCHSEKGVCQKCYGLDANGKHLTVGSNVGVLSAHTLGERAVQLTLKAFHCLHEHSLVLVRHKGRVYHTTLRAVFEGSPGTEPEVRIPQDLEVWGPEGWVRVLSASRHLQEPGTQMVFARTRSGFGLLSQDNHPHMLAENLAVCERCGTYPKRSNGGKQHYCRRCGRTWQGELPEPEDFQMVMPSELSEKSHTAKVSWGPSPTEQNPPLRSGWLAGMFCAEGYIHAQNREQGSYVIGFGISQNQGTPVYTKLGACLAQEFPEARLGARPRAFQVYGRERGLFFEKTFGRYSRNKGLPEGWSGLPVDWLADFVSGVFDGDGTLVSTKDSAWKVGRIDTTSYLLAQQLHHILRSRGVHSRVLLSPWRKASLHQGFAVTFPITAEAKEMLSSALKLANVEARPHGNEERFGEVVDYVRPVRFGAPPWVYDLETETSTLCVNNVWTHNSGGVASAGGGAIGSFGRLEQLTYLPDQIPNSAVHANVSGKITKIEPTPTGTNIWVGQHMHFVGKDSKGNPLHEKQEGVFHTKPWSPPQVGKEVKPGDFLSDPNRTHLNPHRFFEATKSMDRVQEKLAEEMHGLYADEGVRKRAVEVVVRSMGNLTQIEHPGGSPDFLRGQTYSRSAVEQLNKELKAKGQPLVVHKPVLRGVNLLPLDMTTDWMARLNHQKLRGTMMEGAAQGWASDIHGRHPVPGLMYGAEFGRKSMDPRKAGKTNFY